MADFLTQLAERALGLAPVVEPVIAPRFASDPGFESEEQEPMLAFEEPPPETPRQNDTALGPPDPAAHRLSPPAPAPSPPVSEPAVLSRGIETMEASQSQPLTADNSEKESGPPDRERPLLPVPEASTLSLAPLESPDINAAPSGSPDMSAAPGSAVLPYTETIAQPSQAEEESGIQHIPAQPAVEAAPLPEAPESDEGDKPQSPAKNRAPRTVEESLPDPARPFSVQPVAIQPQATSAPERASGPAAPAEEATEPPAVRVTIGRVEVRAVFTPPQPKAEPAESGPALTLAEYLKQRNGGKR